MALGDGGLDAQVEQRMDAYRGNPGQLQKRYGQNKELMDLLALQKLKVEKEQIAQAMAMEAEQQPGTIAEQREAEALELVKQEQAGTLGDLQARTKDTLAQNQKQQKRGMDKMAKGAGKPPQQAGGIAGLAGGQPPRPPIPPQAGPQAAGLPNARMMQAARGGPVRRMSQGGIVGFAGEDGNNQVKKRPLTETQKQAFRDEFGGAANRLIKEVEAGTGNTYNLFGYATDIARILGDPAPPGVLSSLSGLLGGDGGGFDPDGLAKPKATGDLGEGKGVTLGVPNQITDTPPAGIQTLTPPTEISKDFPPDGKGITKPTGIDTGPAYTTAAPEVVEKQEPAFETSDGLTTPQVELPDKPDLIGGDPMGAMQEGFAAANKETGRAEKAAEYDSMLAEMKAFDEENYDPERERKDRLKTFLMGAAGTTNVGTTFAQAGASSFNLANKQRVDRRSRLQDKFNMQKSKMATDTELGKTAVQLGQELYAQTSADNRTALTVAASMRAQDLTAQTANADRIVTQMRDDNTQAYRLATVELDRAKLNQKIIDDANTTKQQRIAAANDTLTITLTARENFMIQAEKQVNLEGLKFAVDMAEEGKEKEAAVLAFNTAAAQALVLSEALMDRFGRGLGEATEAFPEGEPTGASLLDVEQRANQILAELLGVPPKNLTEDDVGSVTTTGN